MVTSGASLSLMVKVAEQDVALPQASVAVNVTKAWPVAPQLSDNASKSCVISGSLQLSVAVAEANQAARSSALPFPSHSTVRSPAQLIAGARVSLIEMAWEQVAVLALSQLSSAVTVKVRVKV